MQALSISSQASDPYRAGIELGEGLAPLSPEIVFVFSTVHYGHSSELLEGLADSLDDSDIVVVGNTGDGYYHQDDCGDVGCVAMGLNSGGKVHWCYSTVSGVNADPEGCLLKAWSALQDEEPRLLFMFSDFRTDASLFEKVLREQIKVPVVGGIAADDNQMVDCAVYAGGRCMRDSLVLVSASGDFYFSIHVGNSIAAVGKPGTIGHSEGTSVFEIDGLSAMDFIERETGKPVLQSDGGTTSLMILNPDDPSVRRLRAIVPDFSVSDRSVGLYGGIEQGERVQVCRAESEQLLAEVSSVAAQCREQKFQPRGVLVVSCAHRKSLLGEEIKKEVSELVTGSYSELPLAGFPSFGEIAPLPVESGYSENLFHNMTYVVLLLG